MSDAKYKEWILETIDSLRKRKARPDLERICHMVERKHNLSFAETEADLEKLVETGVVIKVDYKGSTSYRNAAKWRKSHLNANDATRRVQAALNALLSDVPPLPEASSPAATAPSAAAVAAPPGADRDAPPLAEPQPPVAAADTTTTSSSSDPPGSPQPPPPPPPPQQPTEEERKGVCYSEIEKRLGEDSVDISPLIPSAIKAVLNQEVSSGRLRLLPSGNYIRGTSASSSGNNKPTSSPKSSSDGNARQNNNSAGGPSPTKKGRPPGVKRKIKQVSKSPKEPKAKRPCSSTGSNDDAGFTTNGSNHSRDSATSPDPTTPGRSGGGPGDHRHHHFQRQHDDDQASAMLTDDADKEVATMVVPSTSGVMVAIGGSSSQASAGRSSVASSGGGVGGDGMTYIEAQSKCDYCLLTSECNRVGQAEALLYCKDCQAKAHPSCMDYSEDLAKRARNSPWQCIDCKTCYVCEDSNDPDAMLFCDACDKGYHMNCHNPKVLEKPTGKWVCSKCVLELGMNGDALEEALEGPSQTNGNASSENNNTSSINKNAGRKADGSGASCLPTPSDSPIYFHEMHADRNHHEPKDHHRPSLTLKISNRHPMPTLPRLSETMPAVVPDASEWTIEDVVQFFRNVGFIDQAEVFREQEIDGKSLLLMRRSDVLTGLSLKLGPALKIYSHVQRLQMRCDSTY